VADPQEKTMNTFAAIILFLWVAGWTIASIRAGLKARVVACPGCREHSAGLTTK